MKKHFRSAEIILIDKKNRTLLQHRTDHAPEGAREWGLFGGTVEKGETHLAALKRELREELEYEVTEPKLVLVHKSKDMKATYSVRIYFARFDDSQKLVLHEGQDMKWVTLRDAFEMVKNPVFQKGLKKIQSTLTKK